jgi:cellulose synthase/poly-beta-1,6-N-acetylglucosamine synthase-like glycosyltransferase
MTMALATDILGWTLLALAMPGTLYLGVLTVAGSLPRRSTSTGRLAGRLAIVVPAHDEENGIARTVENLVAEAAVDGATDVVVIADNCSDATAERARAAGAQLIVREDPRRHGKGFALQHAFESLHPARYAAYIVIDADSRVDSGFLAAIRKRFGSGALAVQARYTVLNADESPRTRLAELALAAWNVLRPRGRDRLGVSVGLLGNGFALRREVLDSVPYTAASVVEDLEYHLALVKAGIRVRFADLATVRGEMPSMGAAAATQRARWEGGRLQMLRCHGARLAARSLRGDGRFVDPLADLLLPPLAYLVALVLGGLVAGLLAGGSFTIAQAAALMLALIGAHVVSAVSVAGLPWQRLRLLAHVPGYLLWKLLHLGGVLRGARRDAPWVRTARNPSKEGASS